MLLATNFYTHFGLSNADVSEYDTDIMLEYEDSETYKEYKEFFYDVLSEFEKFGRIVQFKVSCKQYYGNFFSSTLCYNYSGSYFWNPESEVIPMLLLEWIFRYIILIPP